jgi:hypothetical protein
MFNIHRRFIAARRAAAKAVAAAETSKNDLGLVAEYVDDRTGWR